MEDREERGRYILRRNLFRAEGMHKTKLSKREAIGEKIEKANRYLYEHKQTCPGRLPLRRQFMTVIRVYLR